MMREFLDRSVLAVVLVGDIRETVRGEVGVSKVLGLRLFRLG
jgi:hypothetical protein